MLAIDKPDAERRAHCNLSLVLRTLINATNRGRKYNQPTEFLNNRNIRKSKANPAMKSERWQEIEELFHSALQREPVERAAFLHDACIGDPELRRQVEALLASLAEAGDFIEQAPLAGAISSVVQKSGDDASQETNLSLIGRRIGHYQIQSLLGAGGMGEVYLARDLMLDRPVALKMLPAQLTQDEAQVQRFEREARAASGLNNPHIITIHEIGQEGELHFIATELIQGQTLRQQLAGGRLQPDRVVDIASQIAAALSAAHAAGIIHRDIKPENVMMRDDGLVKVLDFGLAKPIDRDPLNVYSHAMPEDALRTSPEVYMGTASYMSPEQVLRENVDHRADIFGLGVVMHEMTTGERPFMGATAPDIFEAILHHDANIDDELPVPIELKRIIQRALEKSKEARYQTVDALRDDLRTLGREAIEGKPTSVKAKAALALTGLLILAGLFYVMSRSNPTVRASDKPLVIGNSIPIAQERGTEHFPSLSPDGESLVYTSAMTGNWDIYLRRIGERDSINLTSNFTPNASQPAFSPDGQRIAFESHGICTMNTDGDDIKQVTDEGNNPAWSPDSKEIAYAMDRIISPDRTIVPSQLWAVNVETGARRIISNGDAVQPNWSPHGYRIAFWGVERGGRRNLWTIAANGENLVAAVDDDFQNWNPVWSPDGAYLYFVSDRNGTMNLWRLPIDEKTGKVLGQAEPITIPSAYIEQVSFSRDGGRMAYARVDKKANIKRVGFDSRNEKIVGEPRWVTQGSSLATQPDISGDGRRLVFNSFGEKDEDLFVASVPNTGASEKVRLIGDIYKDRMPRWSPDGQRIAFYSDRSGNFEIWLVNKDGSDLQQLSNVASETAYAVVPVWSPDGSRLVYYVNNVNTFIIEVRKDGAGQSPQPLAEPDSNFKKFLPASWSRDGLKLAGWKTVGANQSAGVVVYSFDKQTYEQLTDSGSTPRWLNDNRRLLFLNESKLQIVDSLTRRVATVMEIPPDGFFGFAISGDEKLIYFTQASTEIDIWVSETR